MNEMANYRPIEAITEEILFYKAQAGAAILEIGKRLNEAKAQLPHGEWLGWLQEKVDFSESTAQRFMRLAKEYENPSPVTDLGASKALVLLALPPLQRDEFLEENDAAEMSKRELEKAVKEKLEAMEKAEAARKAQEAAEAEIEQEKATALAAQENAAALRRELEELKSRPTEVAVETVDASEEQIAQARKEGRAAAQEEIDAFSKLAEEKEQEAEKAKEAAKKKLEALGKKLLAAEEAERTAVEAQKQAEAKAEELRKRLTASDANVALFKALFTQVQNSYEEMLGYLDSVEENDAETGRKLRKAVQALLAKWVQQAEGGEN